MFLFANGCILGLNLHIVPYAIETEVLKQGKGVGFSKRLNPLSLC